MDDPFADNVVITSHYTCWNFVPKFLCQQFSRFANAVSVPHPNCRALGSHPPLHCVRSSSNASTF